MSISTPRAVLPSKHRPQKPEDFCGTPARRAAEVITRHVAAVLPTGESLCYMANGKPGLGKSSLSNFFVNALGASKWSVQTYNGAQFGIDKVTEIEQFLRLRDMFGNYRVVRLEEVDKCSQAAQVALLTLLDELPKNAAVFATSNKSIEDFEERFQRRFHVLELKTPNAGEIAAFLEQRFGIPKSAAATLELQSGGNVDIAFKSAEMFLLRQP